MANTGSATADTLLTKILSHADTIPSAPALVCGSEKVAWNQLRDRVLQVAGAVASTVSDVGSPVALIGHTSVDLIIAFLGIVTAGRCAVPLPVSLQTEDLTALIQDCAPEIIFADGFGASQINGKAAEKLVRLDRFDSEGPHSFLASGARLSAPIEVVETVPFNVIYSSGTTGRPKGIIHDSGMRFRQSSRSLFGLDRSKVMLLATPLYSNATLLPLLSALYHGATTVLMSKFDAEGYLDLAETHRATHTLMVPIQYQRILSARSFEDRDLSAFELKQSTGAAMSTKLKRDIVSRWPGRLLEVYGLTEGGCTCILDVTRFPAKLDTVGQPAPGNDIRIIDDQGNELSQGEQGEIVGRSMAMMSGYLNNPSATAAFQWRNPEGLVFHRTGDIGQFDQDGFLKLLDRKKDMIISGGFNIFPSDLEEKLVGHPDVSEAAVIGVPSEQWGETPHAYVVLRPNPTHDPSEILAWLNGRVGKMQRVSTIEAIPTLPRSNVGKVLKPELRRRFVANLSIAGTSNV